MSDKLGRPMLIGVKVGSSLLTDGEGSNREYMLTLCRQAAILKRSSHKIFLVTSGAVASEPYKKHISSNLRAAIGQAGLMGKYRNLFGIYGIRPAQILVTDEDFNRSFNSVAIKTIEETFRLGWTIPVINANDAISNKELEALSVCADNDRLSMLICKALGNVDLMIIGMDERGLKDKTGGIIRQVSSGATLHPCLGPLDLSVLLSFVNGCSEKGHGNDGMRTKITVAYHLMEAGVKVVLAPGREKDFILRAVAGEANFGTTFLPG